MLGDYLNLTINFIPVSNERGKISHLGSPRSRGFRSARGAPPALLARSYRFSNQRRPAPRPEPTSQPSYLTPACRLGIPTLFTPTQSSMRGSSTIRRARPCPAAIWPRRRSASIRTGARDTPRYASPPRAARLLSRWCTSSVPGTSATPPARTIRTTARRSTRAAPPPPPPRQPPPTTIPIPCPRRHTATRRLRSRPQTRRGSSAASSTRRLTRSHPTRCSQSCASTGAAPPLHPSLLFPPHELSTDQGVCFAVCRADACCPSVSVSAVANERRGHPRHPHQRRRHQLPRRSPPSARAARNETRTACFHAPSPAPPSPRAISARESAPSFPRFPLSQAMFIAAWLAWFIEGPWNADFRTLESGVYWAVVSLTTARCCVVLCCAVY